MRAKIVIAGGAVKRRFVMLGSIEPMSADTGHIDFAGPQTIREAEQSRSMLIAALHGSQTVVIDCSSVTDVDLSFVQILLSAQKTASIAGKTIDFSSPLSNTLRDVLRRAGLLCSSDGAPLADDAFWFRRETVNV
jgi:anti-anti-sigma regulatory factor